MFSPTLDTERCSSHSVQKMFSSALDAERCSSTPNLESTKCFHRHLTQKDVHLIQYKKCFHRHLTPKDVHPSPNLESTKCFHRHLTQKDVHLIQYKKCFHRHLTPKDVCGSGMIASTKKRKTEKWETASEKLQMYIRCKTNHIKSSMVSQLCILENCCVLSQ